MTTQDRDTFQLLNHALDGRLSFLYVTAQRLGACTFARDKARQNPGIQQELDLRTVSFDQARFNLLSLWPKPPPACDAWVRACRAQGYMHERHIQAPTNPVRKESWTRHSAREQAHRRTFLQDPLTTLFLHQLSQPPSQALGGFTLGL